MEALDTIPKWSDSERMQPLALLDLQLRQFLIMLYSQYAQRTGSDSKTRYSRIVCFDTSTILLDIHTRLIDSGNFTLCLNRMDHFRAALSICQVTFRSTFLPSMYFIRDWFPSGVTNILTRWNLAPYSELHLSCTAGPSLPCSRRTSIASGPRNAPLLVYQCCL